MSPERRALVWAITVAVRPSTTSSSATEAASLGEALSPWRAIERRALMSTRAASVALASASSASSPVIERTPALASSLRSLRCAEIDRARRPAERRRSRTLVRDAAPAPCTLATRAMIKVIALVSRPESVG